MKKILPLLVLLVFIVSCNLPFAPGASEATSTPYVIVVTPENPEPIVVTATMLPEQQTAAAQPTEPLMMSTPTLVGTPLTSNGVSMTIPGCLPVTVSGGMVSAQNYDPMGGPQEVFPQHRRFEFSGYPLTSISSMAPASATSPPTGSFTSRTTTTTSSTPSRGSLLTVYTGSRSSSRSTTPSSRPAMIPPLCLWAASPFPPGTRPPMTRI